MLYNDELSVYEIDVDYEVSNENVEETHRIVRTRRLKG